MNFVLGIIASVPVLGCLSAIMLTYFLTIWSDRNLDFVCTLVTHNTVDVPIWLSFVFAVFCNVLVLPFNIISEIARVVIH